jgi:hypothetical protein
MVRLSKPAARSTTVLSICFLCLILLIFYIALDTRGSFRFQERPGTMHYGMIAEALVSGQLHLKQQVDPGRLKSRDPLDPSTPYPYQFDLIIWDGKYYLPREPLPGLIRAAVLYTTGFALPTGIVVVTFAFGVLILLGALLWLVRRRYYSDSPSWMLWYIWISFAVSGTQLYIAGRPVVYNESDAIAIFFILAGSVLLVYAFSGARRTLITVCFSGTCFGAAVACRALLLLYPMCFLVIFLVFAAIRRDSIKTTMKWTLSFGGPVALCAGGLLAYNYLRFGDPLEFGYTHVIVPEPSAYLYLTLGGKLFRWDHVPHQLYYYLLSFPRIVSKFPFLRYHFGALWVGDIYVVREAVCSVFLAMPVLLLSLPFPFLVRRVGPQTRLSLILVFFGTSSLVVLAVLSAFYASAARYYYEFTPLLFVVSFCNLAVFWDEISTSVRRKTAAKVFLSLLFTGNVFMGLLLGVTGATY